MPFDMATALFPLTRLHRADRALTVLVGARAALAELAAVERLDQPEAAAELDRAVGHLACAGATVERRRAGILAALPAGGIAATAARYRGTVASRHAEVVAPERPEAAVVRRLRDRIAHGREAEARRLARDAILFLAGAACSSAGTLLAALVLR